MLLKQTPQWLIWDLRNGNKVPLNKWGQLSGSTHAQDYLTWDEAFELSETRPVMGPAFCFTADDPFVGIDLDNCLDDHFKPKNWVKPILHRFAGTYREISPSLQGIKIYCIGSLPSGRPCQVSAGDGRIEIYDQGRFFTFTGISKKAGGSEDATNQQDAIDWLYKTHWPDPNREPRTVDILLDCKLSGLPCDAAHMRAEAYLQSADLPLLGERNNTAFRLAGNLAAIEGLPQGDVLPLMKGWNARLPEPLPEDELQRVVRNALEKGTPREIKPATPQDDLSDIDIAGLTVPAKTIPGIVQQSGHLQQMTRPNLDFPNRLLTWPGFLGDYVQYVLETAHDPQPQLTLAGGLALLSLLTGRKLTDNLYGTRTNIYALCVAPSGSGKEHPRTVNKDILTACGHPELCGPERIGSSAGLVSWVAEHPAILLQLDEMGRFLQTTSSPGKASHLYNVISVLMTLYTSAGKYWVGDAYADIKRTPEIDDPHPVLYGTTTPGQFWKALTRDSIADGFLGRLMLFEGGYVKPQDAELKDVPQGLIDQAKFWLDYTGGTDIKPTPIVAQVDRDAAERLRGHRAGIADRRLKEDENVAALWSRTSERTSKLALLLAASRQQNGDVRIAIQDVDAAIELSNWMTRRVLQHLNESLADNQSERDLLRVVQIIKDAGGTIERSQLTRKTQFLKNRDRKDILQTLLEGGAIESIGGEPGANGKIKIFFRLTGDLEFKAISRVDLK